MSHKRESIFDVPDPDILPDNEHTDDVEPIAQAAAAMAIDPDPGRSPQLHPLAVVDSLQGAAKGIAASCLDLDERHLVAPPHHEVDITMSAAEPMRDHHPS